MIALHIDAVRGNAAGFQHRTNFTHGRCRGAGIRRVDRHLGEHRAGTFPDPHMGQSHHIVALRGRETAAGVTDEDDDRVIAFLDPDRVTQAVIVRHAAGDDGVGRLAAGAQHDRQPGEGEEEPKGTAAGR